VCSPKNTTRHYLYYSTQRTARCSLLITTLTQLTPSYIVHPASFSALTKTYREKRMTSTSNNEYQEAPSLTASEGGMLGSNSPEPAPVAEQQKEHSESSHSMPCNPPKELDADAGQRGRSKSRSFVHPSHRYHQTMVTRSTEAGQLLKLRFDVSSVYASAHRYRSASRSASRCQSVDRSQQRRGA
jgi:hypothetical protein